MVALPDRLLMSYEEYRDWEANQEMRHEYFNGEIIPKAGGTKNHNRVSLNFFKFLDDASGKSLGDRHCEVYIADVKVQVEPSRKYFYPDVVVTCDESDRDPQLVMFPCLIIEVLSPSTEAYDRGFKFSQYRQFPSLQEYVLVQTEQPVVEIFQREHNGKWWFAEYGLGDRLLLKSLNLEILVDDLFKQVQFA
ncbi:Uma2 family endonuclease [Pseudanabaena sp. FACHB-1998]|uniref:Uma2 family endonuclease n=1 Tax=Pseudanabaena sp. FACHB-1998 TaxID=2692858 RepID=UPI0016817262|nr:Uma2 family endonuclease [Pseudanabaena sp. FACHB-1998]MBD2178921.1 Uma2 family endonuclease [Pseudanabaena sp. FACHB-1998]